MTITMHARVYVWSFAAICVMGVAAFVVLYVLASWSRRLQAPRSVPDRLADCPSSPNCVCSQATREARTVPPFEFSGDAEASMLKLIGVLDMQSQATIVTREPFYLHVEFRSPFFGFVDDVEFLADESAKVIHVRSASRIGYSDAGANRKRIETLRVLYQHSL